MPSQTARILEQELYAHLLGIHDARNRSATLLVTVAAAPGSFAQEADDSEANRAANGAGIEEVTVTATWREDQPDGDLHRDLGV